MSGAAMMRLSERYRNAVATIPPPGHGCHPALLGVANLGALAGLPAEKIFQDICKSIPPGRRRITDREITDAIQKAVSDHQGGTFIPRPRPQPVIQDGKSALQKIIDQGTISDEADLWEASPLRLWDEPIHDPILFLETIFEPNDLVWIGERHEAGILGQNIKTAGDWVYHFQKGGQTAPHIIVNPLTGLTAIKKAGDGETFRGDGNISTYRYCLVEFDNLSRDDQIRFWSAVKLPIAALIDTGGKSIHAWLDVQKLATIATSEQWVTEVKGYLYDQILRPLGVDGACSNPARLSRLPGHFRQGKGMQKILWLSPEGKALC